MDSYPISLNGIFLMVSDDVEGFTMSLLVSF